jgi:hypothetical protein
MVFAQIDRDEPDARHNGERAASANHAGVGGAGVHDDALRAQFLRAAREGGSRGNSGEQNVSIMRSTEVPLIL